MRFWLLLILSATAAMPSIGSAGWDLQQPPTGAHLYDVTAHHGNINMAWACGAGGTILFTSNGGATWSQQESGTTNDLHGIAFHEIAGSVVAVGAGGTILRTTNQGATWTPLPSGTLATLRSVSDFGMFIVGDDGTILKGDQAGVTWTPMDSGTTADLFSVCGSFSTYAAGENGTVRAYHNALGWFPRESGTTANLYGTPLFGNANYIVGGGGLVLHSSNGGIDWSPQSVGTAAALRDIQISTNNTSRLYAVGDAGVIIRTTNQGATWGFQQSGTTEILHGVFFYLNDNQGWAVGENATILRTNDAGGPVVLGVTPQDVTGVNSDLRLAGYPNPFQNRATFTVHLNEPGRIVLDLFDPAGRRIGGWRGEAARRGEQQIVVDVDRHLPAGVVFVRLATPAGTATGHMLHIP